MDENTRRVQMFYDNDPALEWGRMDRHPIEFELTKRYLERYIQPGQRVIDVGGGPGRYALHLAARGCDVTLADLSDGNVAFARAKAEELCLPLTAVQADARALDDLNHPPERFDHALLMGPLYHLGEEADRVRAVEGCLRMLKPGGCLFASFVTLYAGAIYDMKYDWENIHAPKSRALFDAVARGEAFVGDTFTYSCFLPPMDVPAFFERFDTLYRLHIVATESLLGRNEPGFRALDERTRARWYDLAEAVCERPEIWGSAEHMLYVGRKGLM